MEHPVDEERVLTDSPAPVAILPRDQIVAGVANLALAGTLVAVAILLGGPQLPVTLTLPSETPVVFARVDLALAAGLVVLVAAAARILVGVTAARGQAPRLVGVRMLELSQTTAITVFLVAQLNGVTEAGTLILIYAIAAGAVAVLWMHSRALPAAQRSAWPYSVAAAIAVVPWGIVALYQVAALLAGGPPAVLVRVLTVVLLLLAAAAWAIERRVHVGALDRARAERLHSAVQLTSGILLLSLALGVTAP